MSLSVSYTASPSLYTQVKNPTRGSLFYGFLPPFGQKLASYGLLNIYGTLDSYINTVTCNDRKRHSLEAALENGQFEIMHTPAVVLFDHTLDHTKVLYLNNNSVTLVNPTWGGYSSSASH